MLEPRQVDFFLLFLVLVVLPVVLYILLGKWSEASNKKKRVVSILVEEAVESFRSETMAGPSVISPVVIPRSSSSVVWECARCHGPATTRCSRCKSVRYCSGRCQIIHWRQGHKERCVPPDNIYSSSNPSLLNEAFINNNNCPSEVNVVNSAGAFTPDASNSGEAFQVSKQERSASEKRVSRKVSKRMDSRDKAASLTSESHLRSIPDPSREACLRPKLRGRDLTNSEDGFSEISGINGSMPCDKNSARKGKLRQSPGVKSQTQDSLSNGKSGINVKGEALGYNLPVKEGAKCTDEVLKRNKSALDGECVNLSESVKVAPKASRKGHGSGESVLGMGYITSPHESNGITSVGLTKADELKKLSKISRNATCEKNIVDYKKVKVMFPFEEFVKFFELQVFELVPRGLMNIGNSCYANAVLQCLMCTKPLVVYLLNRTHSRTCYLNNWCLMCELEQHMHMLRDASGPLSPSRILSHIRSTNCQMGDGSQEDAHEFLRLLVASMQSICLEEAGGENKVHPVLQETTFVQQTFGGRLRSMVVCLRCHHESERYENIMDLTLEIYGWVESLQDALTQFTTPEDLDGENMYRCGRCASYVRARKQLSIDEAPNILTIVLKRFQEGNYGKINKCITFPEMLDMVPFMTGANDSPPLYMLYGVVVHVDTLNASFSGHYVSYVKDLQGNWFRIDDTVVQPVHVSQVMSEGAYILFYMRSFPRPPRAYIKNVRKLNPAKSSKSSISKPNNSSKIGLDIHRSNVRINRAMETYMNPNFTEFSDATTSDWSLFTSSDDASFTSESTRDSFSTADNSDNGNLDPFSSKFGAYSQRMVSCSMFSGIKPVTRFVSEQTGYVLDSEHAVYPLDDYQARGSVPFSGDFGFQNEYHNFVNYDYDSTACDSFTQMFTNVKL